jgi:uncharacterized membrane protein YraQ (UPF0718 family)
MNTHAIHVEDLLLSLVAAVAVAALLVVLVRRRRPGEAAASLESARSMILVGGPMIILGVLMAGAISALLPHELIQSWIGPGSGWRGLLVACAAGILIPGEPVLALPFLAGLERSGAAIGVIVALLCSWTLLGLSRLPVELGVLGPRLTLVRMAAALPVPVLAGALAQSLAGVV